MFSFDTAYSILLERYFPARHELVDCIQIGTWLTKLLTKNELCILIESNAKKRSVLRLAFARGAKR